MPGHICHPHSSWLSGFLGIRLFFSSPGAPIPGKSWPESQAAQALLGFNGGNSSDSAACSHPALAQFPPQPSPAHVLVHGLGDELSLTVDAGVGSLAGDLLLLLGNAAWRRGAAAGVQRAWTGTHMGQGGNLPTQILPETLLLCAQSSWRCCSV